EHALAPRKDAGWIAEIVEEDRRLVVGAVGFGLFEELDFAAELTLAVDAERIIAHLDDPELAVRPPGEGDGVHDERLGGHEFGCEAGPRLHALERFLRRLGARLHHVLRLSKRNRRTEPNRDNPTVAHTPLST